MQFIETPTNYSSLYANETEVLLVVYNPSQ